MEPLQILIIEDDPAWHAALKDIFERVFLVFKPQITVADTIDSAHREISQKTFDLASVDLNIGQTPAGLDILKHIYEKNENNQRYYVLFISGIFSDPNVHSGEKKQEFRTAFYLIDDTLSEYFTPERSYFVKKLAPECSEEQVKEVEAKIRQQYDDILIATGRMAELRISKARREWKIRYQGRTEPFEHEKARKKQNELLETKYGMPGVEWLAYLLENPVDVSSQPCHQYYEIQKHCQQGERNPDDDFEQEDTEDSSEAKDEFDSENNKADLNKAQTKDANARGITSTTSIYAKNKYEEEIIKILTGIGKLLGFNGRGRERTHNWEKAMFQVASWRESITEENVRTLCTRLSDIDQAIIGKKVSLHRIKTILDNEELECMASYFKYRQQAENIYYAAKPKDLIRHKKIFCDAILSWFNLWEQLNSIVDNGEVRKPIDRETGKVIKTYIDRRLKEIERKFPEVHEVLRGTVKNGQRALRFSDENASGGCCYDEKVSGVSWLIRIE